MVIYFLLYFCRCKSNFLAQIVDVVEMYFCLSERASELTSKQQATININDITDCSTTVFVASFSVSMFVVLFVSVSGNLSLFCCCCMHVLSSSYIYIFLYMALFAVWQVRWTSPRARCSPTPSRAWPSSTWVNIDTLYLYMKSFFFLVCVRVRVRVCLSLSLS